MKKFISYTRIIVILVAGVGACKPKKCANFQDPRHNYKARYNKKGLVKSKNRNKGGSWSDKY